MGFFNDFLFLSPPNGCGLAVRSPKCLEEVRVSGVFLCDEHRETGEFLWVDHIPRWEYMGNIGELTSENLLQ